MAQVRFGINGRSVASGLLAAGAALGRSLEWVDRRLGWGLPLLALGYPPMLGLLILPYALSPAPVPVHGGADCLSAVMVSAFLAVVVVPVSLVDLWRRRWPGLLAAPLALSLYPVWQHLYGQLVASGRVVVGL